MQQRVAAAHPPRTASERRPTPRARTRQKTPHTHLQKGLPQACDVPRLHARHHLLCARPVLVRHPQVQLWRVIVHVGQRVRDLHQLVPAGAAGGPAGRRSGAVRCAAAGGNAHGAPVRNRHTPTDSWLHAARPCAAGSVRRLCRPWSVCCCICCCSDNCCAQDCCCVCCVCCVAARTQASTLLQGNVVCRAPAPLRPHTCSTHTHSTTHKTHSTSSRMGPALRMQRAHVHTPSPKPL
jgi:hypothetical protein